MTKSVYVTVLKPKLIGNPPDFEIELEAANGLEAMQLLSEQPLPDVVITDVRMPQMDGIAFIKASKEKFPIFVSSCFRATRILNI